MENKNNEELKQVDPFDPVNLRLNQNFSDILSARKALVMLQVRKPPNQEFIRVNPDEEMWIEAAILEWEADRELYLVTPNVAEIIGKEAKPRRLIPTITATKHFFLWPMKITLSGDRENTWNQSANAAAELAKTMWVNISSNQAAQAYDVRIAEGNIPAPEWPILSLKELLKLAFKDRFIQDLNHPVIKKLKGIL